MERILFQVDFDNANAKKKVNELEKSIMNLKDSQTSLKNSYKQGLVSQEQYIEKNQELNQSVKNLKNEQNSYQRELDLVDKALNSNALSYQELYNATALAEKQLKQMQGTLKINKDGSVELSEEYEKQSAKVKQLRETLVSFDLSIKNGKTNVGNYASAFDELGESFGGAFGQFGQGIQAINGLKASFISLFTTLLANPFIALAAVLGAILGYFLSTEKGAKKMAQTMAGLNAIFAPLLALISNVGEILFEIVDGFIDVTAGIFGMIGAIGGLIQQIPGLQTVFDVIYGIVSLPFTAFKGFTSFIGSFNKGYNEAKNLEKQMQGLEVRAKKMEVISAKNLADQERLKNFRDNELNSFEERTKANEQAFALERKRGADLIKIKQEELDKLNKKLALTPKELQTTEMQMQILEKEKDIQDTIADSLGKQNEYITEKTGLLRDNLTAMADIRTAQLETQILEGKIVKGSANELKARKDLAKERLKIDLQQYQQGIGLQKLGKDFAKLSEDEKIKRIAETNISAKVSYQQYLQETAQLNSDFNSEQKEKSKEAQDNFAQAQIAGLEVIKLAYQSYNNDRLKTEIDLVRANLRQQLLDTTLSIQQRTLLQKTAEADIAQLKLDFQNRTNTAVLERQLLATTEGTKARLDIEIKSLENQKNIELQNKELSKEERLKIEADYNKQIDDLNETYNNSQIARQQRLADATLAIQKNRVDIESKIENIALQNLQTDLDEAIQKRGFATEEELLQKQNLQSVFFDTQKQQLETQTNLELQTIQTKLEREREAALQRLGDGEEYELEKQALQAEADAQVLTATQNQALALVDIETQKVTSLKALDKERTMSQQQQLNLTGEIIGKTKEFFSEETIAYKILATSEAIISTYLAAQKAFATGGGVPFGSILAGLTIAQGLATVAKINAVPTFAKGGIFGGRPHSAGGTKGYFDDGTQIEVEKGEAFAIVNKKNTPLLQTLSSVNSAGGNGVPYFQNGGVMNLGQSILESNIQNNSMIELLRMIPAPIVRITDLENVQKNISIVDSLANA